MKNKINIFLNNIKSWWYNLFNKSKKIAEYSGEEVNDVVETSHVKEENILAEYRRKTERYNYLMQLQKRFENKSILESEISDIDKADLEDLYMEQIDNLKRNIAMVERKIQKLK